VRPGLWTGLFLVAAGLSGVILFGGLGDASARALLLAGSLLALGVGVLASALAAQRISRRVRSLTQAAQRMASGDLLARSRVSGAGDLGELGQTLDALAENLSRTLGELRAERDLLGGVLDAMTEGVLLLDAEGRIVMMNPALREMLLAGPEAIGKRPLEVIRRADLAEVLERARAGPAPAREELELPGLRPRRVLVHAVRLRHEPRTLLAVLVDVTDLRRLETLRRDFVANVSHELRTPVAAVRSAAETLRGAMQKDPVAALGFVDIIERNADRLHRLFEDLLDLSRIESRELSLSPEPVELGDALRHAAGLFQERAEKKRLALAVEADGLTAQADRRALEQVLSNLLDNAIKYCPEGARIRVRAGALEGGAARISVEDSGPGIEARHLPRLFERFYRVDAGRSRELGGTGLGLSIVKHLVEAMGGTIEVESSPGRGTVFSFTLPPP
jgi:two-component system phosphate regulon sensor histidine kinase PhoR